MEKRSVKKVEAACAAHLEPGEQVEHVCIAGVMPSDRATSAANGAVNAAAAAAMVASAVLIGFGMARFTVARRYFLVLTDRRLLFVDMDMKHARPLETLSFAVSRDGFTARRVASFPSGKVALIDSSGEELGVLFFPLATRNDGTNLLKRLASSDA